MMAASRSRPECSASERTPKLPVRITRKALSETSKTAEPTLSNAALRFSRASSLRAAITVRLDYQGSRVSALFERGDARSVRERYGREARRARSLARELVRK